MIKQKGQELAQIQNFSQQEFKTGKGCCVQMIQRRGFLPMTKNFNLPGPVPLLCYVPSQTRQLVYFDLSSIVA